MNKILKGLYVPNGLLLVLLWMGLGATYAHAQVSAAVSGSVSDGSGAILPGTVIEATNTGTGILTSTISDEQGRYRFPDMPIGEYSIEAAQPGFQTVIRKVTLTVGSNPVVDFSLPVGQLLETVNVEAEVSQVDTSSAAIGSLVEQTQMRELPLNGRSYTSLLTLAPGVTSFASGGASGALFGSQTTYSVSGSRAVGMLFLLDNTNTTGYWNKGGGSGALGTALGVDSIDQFQTLTNTYSAQYGGSGAVINASTKSGTNALHGSVYEFLRNSALEARQFFDGDTVPPYRQNQFGGTLGGPVRKDKAFFFANYEGFRSSKTVSEVVTVPDAMAHQFMTPNAAGVYTPVAENPNPATAAAVRAALKLFPVAHTLNLRDGNPTGTGFLTMPNKVLGYENYVIGRFDYNLSDKDSLFVRYVLDRSSKTSLVPLKDTEVDVTRNNYVTIQERHIFSPRVLNIMHVSFVRNAESGDSPERKEALQWFPGEGRVDGTVSPGSSITSVGINAGTLPFYLISNKFGIGDDVIWTHGAHSITTGAKMERLQENTYGPAGVGGTWSFPNLTSFLQGIPTQFSGQLSDTQYPSDAHKDWRERVYALYLQDDWRVSRRLNLNIGLRYEPTANSSWDRHISMNILDAPYGDWEVVKNVHETNIALKNWQPRIGLAWDVAGDQKTSIRAGFGMFNDLLFGSETTMYLQPPFLRGSQTLAQGAVFPFPLTNIPPGSGTIVKNGTISCGPCTYYKATRTPTTYQYNLSVQREIMSSSILTVAFVASHSNFLQVSHDWNYPVPFTGPSGNPVFGQLINGNIVANPRLNPSWSTLSMLNSQGSSHYEGLQMGFNRRFSGGLQAQVSYTFSKSMDVSSGSIIGGGGFTNPTDMRSDYGLSNFHRKNNFKVSSVYRVPFQSRSEFLNKIFGGWQLSGIGSYQSGVPFSPSVGFASTGTGAYTPRPNVIAGCDYYPEVQTLSNWFNTACFTAPPIGEFGNAGRNTLIGPSAWTVDGSLARDIKVPSVSEDFEIQFRAEFFNLPNHPTFSIPNASLYTQGSNGTFLPNATVNKITSTTSQPRQVQFGLKIRF